MGAGKKISGVFALVFLTMGVAGCSLQKSIAIEQMNTMRGIRLIAVMPIKSQAAEEKLMRLMREKVFENVYFKGYPKIPLEVIDERLARIHDKAIEGRANISPQDLDSLLGVDALLYIDVKEFRTVTALIYSSTSVSAAFELRSAKTGETLWRNQCDDVIRQFGLTRSELIVSVHQVLEPAMQEVVERILQSLPEGPEAIQSTDVT